MLAGQGFPRWRRQTPGESSVRAVINRPRPSAGSARPIPLRLSGGLGRQQGGWPEFEDGIAARAAGLPAALLSPFPLALGYQWALLASSGRFFVVGSCPRCRGSSH